jgi:hypothetical protein
MSRRFSRKNLAKGMTEMSRVFSAQAVSVDSYITGRDPGPGCGLGDGTMLFDWYADGDTPSQVFGFALSEPSARVFDALARRLGALTEGLKAGLVDEAILHQVPVLLGAGRPFLQALPEHARLRLLESVPAPEVTHLQYEVAR